MEIIDLYDDNKKLTGEKIERSEKIPEGRYKLSIHIWIINFENKIYIQKRSSNRKIFPNLWENPGGGALSGEFSEQTLQREFQEELGISPNLHNAKLITTIKRKKDFVDIWLLVQDFNIGDLHLQKEEVSEAKWVTLDEIEKMMNNNEFCPTFNESFIPFLDYYKKIKIIEIKNNSL